MRRLLTGLVALAAVVMFGGSAFAKTATVTGKVVDEGCSMMEKGAHGGDHADHQAPAGGNNHAPAGSDHHAAQGGGQKMPADMTECAIMCAKNGEPLALLTEDGKVYRLTGGLAANKNAKLIAHVGHTIEVTGDVTEKDGKIQLAADTLTMIRK